MKKLTLTLVAPLLLGGCLSLESRIDRLVHGENPYLEQPFYARYLNTGSALDARIQQTLDALRANPRSAPLHNELGSLLLRKGFPKDAEREFQRAVAADRELYAAWYNLGLIREARGEWSGAANAYHRTLALKPGHPAALFHLGLLLEKRGRHDAAIEHYARAFAINRAMLDVRVNPRILDTKLADRALLRNYDKAHAEASMYFQAAPASDTTTRETAAGRETTEESLAPSPQPMPRTIVTPAAPATDESQQQVPAPGAAPEEEEPNASEQPMTRQQRYSAALERERQKMPPQPPPPPPSESEAAPESEPNP